VETLGVSQSPALVETLGVSRNIDSVALPKTMNRQSEPASTRIVPLASDGIKAKWRTRVDDARI
jgi:hypothetical protein